MSKIMEIDPEAPSTSFIEPTSPVQEKINVAKDNKDASNWAARHRKKPAGELDPNCIVQIERRLVRVEYPGEVRNFDKAIETLGGIDSLEASVADHGRKLELHFHPRNKYNKSCTADKDFKPGVLIKVKTKAPHSDSSGGEARQNIAYEYDVEGVSVINFNFNRLCDFQYLPLVSKDIPETKSSKTLHIYEKILPSQLPPSDWLENEDAKNMEQFLLPVTFSHFDSAHSKLQVESNEKDEPKLKLRGASPASSKMTPKQRKSVCKIFRKARHQTSIFANFKDPDVPTQALENAVRLLKHRNLENQIGRVKKLFEERPIWTKAAIRYITGLSDEHSKIILPVVAYYFVNGPWRITWVKFGYDPRKDPKARIYQTLDYRIRTAESTKLKVTAKRSYAGKTSLFLGAGQVKRMSLKHDMSAKPKMELDERYYVLRPMTIPPARQMFYQFCDLLLPEVQNMISRLPPSYGTCHPKNGFLPDNFIHQSRQIVNEHVLEAVHKELLEDKKLLQEKESKEKESQDGGSQLDYYNKMLANIRKGIYRNVLFQPSRILSANSDDVELITLSSDEETEYTVGDIIQRSIPERLDGGDEDEQSDISESSDDADIDMEAVQEINEMISQFKEKV